MQSSQIKNSGYFLKMYSIYITLTFVSITTDTWKLAIKYCSQIGSGKAPHLEEQPGLNNVMTPVAHPTYVLSMDIFPGQ